MTQKQQQKTETATPTPDLFRLAELFHMRRIEWHDQSGSAMYYECGLCLGRSSASGEIQHKDGCPVLRLK